MTRSRVSNYLRRLADRIDSIGDDAALPSEVDEIVAELARMIAPHPLAPTIADVVDAVCGHYRIPLAALRSDTRRQHVTFVRHLAMYLCRELTRQSFPAIGDYLGRDHSTVVHAYKLIAARAAESRPFRAGLERLRAALMPAEREEDAA